jgi:glutamyl-tRNA reductase
LVAVRAITQCAWRRTPLQFIYFIHIPDASDKLMNLFVLGINHESAPVAIRERLAFAPDQLEDALLDGVAETSLQELVILSTCNRTELYAFANNVDEASGETRKWLAGFHRLNSDDVYSYSYVQKDDDALRHMIRVASGLDSLILGEPQILGQMKSAFACAQQAGTVGNGLGRLFSHVFAVTKRVRTDTAIGENPVSVAYAAVNLSDHFFSDLSATRALLVGAGETIDLVAKHLREKGVGSMVIANRTLNRAQEIADQFGAEAILLSEIPEQLQHADIVITSTASQLPILGKGAVEQAMKSRRHRPILMVDIAVPRDIEQQVAELEDVYLYTIDDLKEIVDENRKLREHEARKAMILVDEGVESFRQQLRALDAVSTVVAFRRKAEDIRDSELERAIQLLKKGHKPEKVLELLARNLTNKLIHTPSTKLREASAQGRNEVIRWSEELFDLKKEHDLQKEHDLKKNHDLSQQTQEKHTSADTSVDTVKVDTKKAAADNQDN